MHMDKDTNLNETKVDTYEKEPEPLIAEVEQAICNEPLPRAMKVHCE